MRRNQMASQHQFSMIPRSDIPRSTYRMQQNRKTTFNGGALVPIYCEEVLPGDQFNCNASFFARLATPITPVMDNAEMETFFFFVPNRIVWDNWEEFIAGGNFTIPQIVSPVGGFAPLSIYDYFGIPVAGQTGVADDISINALPFRAYNLIFREWFTDQNLGDPSWAPVATGNGPDPATNYTLSSRMKKHDYFTSSLPWPQKGTAVSLPLGTWAPVVPTALGAPTFENLTGTINFGYLNQKSGGDVAVQNPSGGLSQLLWASTGLQADLSTATANTINAIRTAFQVQRMLERDARGGSRYVEQILSHFGVRSPDYRLQRPEYIGGGRTLINTTPIAQTSSTDATTPQGNLAAFSTVNGKGHRFKYAATEHGYIIGLANVRVDLTYQQGLRRHWNRKTRYDYYFPVFSHLGEQAVLSQEIYCTGNATDDSQVFGYQERWAEYRYTPNEITGLFRSTTPNNVDVWHYSEEFATRPMLNSTFIVDRSDLQLARSMAVGDDADGQQILMDMLFTNIVTRPMPTYSVPGLVDHF